MHRLALFALLVGGCSKSDSGDILTSGMYGAISARAEGTGSTNVYTSLYLGKPVDLNFIQLTDGDKLIVRHAGQNKTASESELLNIVSYSASFPTDAAGEMFEVSFERTVDAGAPSSVVTLPAPFTLAAPPATSSRAAAMTLTWSPSGSGDTMHAVLDGACIDALDLGITGDTGTVTIPAGMIKKRTPQQGQTIDDSCTAELRIERSKMGTVDSHFGKGGSAFGIQSRKATFTTSL